MTLYLTQMNMSRGVMSPRVQARMDVDQYLAGAKDATNFIVMKEGGISRRPGTEYRAAARVSVNKTRLIPFIFGTVNNVPQSYILEFSGNKFRIIKPTSGLVSSGGSPVEVTTPYSGNEVLDLDYVQSADVIYLFHKNYPTQKVIRNSDTSWTVIAESPEDGPYQKEPDGGATTVLKIAGTNDLADKAGATYSVPIGTLFTGNVVGSLFDDSLDTYSAWASGGTIAFQIDFAGTEKYVCAGYTIVGRGLQEHSGPYSWMFDGWDGTQWVNLDTQFKTDGWQTTERQYFPIVNKNAYAKYRLYVTGSDGSGAKNYTSITSLELAEHPDFMSSMTLTANVNTDINGGSGFLATDVGRAIRFKGKDGLWRWFKIVSRSGALNVGVTVYGAAISSTQVSTNWRLGAWGDYPGWPSKGSFFEDRLFRANTNSFPQRLWGSKTSDYSDYGISTPLEETDSIDLQMTGGEVNTIQWLAEMQDLIVGTTKTIRAITVANTQQGFSATNVKQQRNVTVGANSVKPVPVGTALLFVDFYGKKIRQLTYSFEANSYIAPDITYLAEHLFQDQIVGMVHVQDPISTLWVVLTNGDMVIITYDMDQKIIACCPCEIGGNGSVEAIATIPTVDRDEIWVVIRRGGDVTIERFADMFDDEEDDPQQARFLDSWKTWAAGTSDGDTNLTGFDHLAGKTVDVLADGRWYQNIVVGGGGTITLPDNVIKAVAGFRCPANFQQLYPQQGLIDGSRIGRRWKIMRVVLDVLASQGIKYGTDRKLFDLFTRTAADGGEDTPMALRNGKYGRFGDFSWKENDTLVIRNESPYPTTILSITVGIEGEP